MIGFLNILILGLPSIILELGLLGIDACYYIDSKCLIIFICKRKYLFLPKVGLLVFYCSHVLQVLAKLVMSLLINGHVVIDMLWQSSLAGSLKVGLSETNCVVNYSC
jgi:hypothetical protein